MKIISLASRIFGILTLTKILESQKIELLGVVPGDDGVSDFAKSRGLPIITTNDINSEAFIETVRKLKAELLVNTYFLQRYKEKILQVPKYGVLNVHPSKLPLYRGRDCLRWAMIFGEQEIGVTAHLMDAGLDTGEIVLQRTFPLAISDYYDEATAKLKQVYPETVVEAILKLGRGEKDGRKQDPGIEGSYFPHRTLGDGRIKWSDPSLDIYNLIRASYEPGFYSYSHVGDQKVYITRANLVRRPDYEQAATGKSQMFGRVLDYDKGDPSKSSMLVGTFDGVISIEKCGPQGNEEAPAREVLKRGDHLT
ncbi:MAG: formyltransferase family protein [Thaumarchaeota archaeon]|nr:formyltransferase family protein [Nitrososphaerota archaeon]